jgi:hypothetical protein
MNVVYVVDVVDVVQVPASHSIPFSYDYKLTEGLYQSS